MGVGNLQQAQPCPSSRLRTLVLQRNLDHPAASDSWTSGAATLPLSGHRPRTQATQSSWATPCRRQTKRQG